MICMRGYTDNVLIRGLFVSQLHVHVYPFAGKEQFYSKIK